MEDINQNVFDYTAIAVTKLETYAISYADMQKIPAATREQMENIARISKQLMIQRTLNLYSNLKSIKSKLEVDDEDTHST